jgi:hypothetical protein
MIKNFFIFLFNLKKRCVFCSLPIERGVCNYCNQDKNDKVMERLTSLNDWF